MRRRRFRRRGRIFKRKRRVLRRNRGTLFCKFTKVATLPVPLNAASDWSLSFVPSDFSEYTALAPNFEYIQFLKVRVRVVPEQNVSNNSTSRLPTYAMLPWHRPPPPGSAITYTQFISSDRAKIFRGSQVGHQSYVPNTLVYSEPTAGGPSGEAHQMIWKPKIARASDNTKLPRIFSGIMAFQGDATISDGNNAYFNIFTDVWVKCVNQNTLMP